jgi:hypothetical protein
MVVLYIDFRISRLAGPLLMHRRNRNIDLRQAETFFPASVAEDIREFPGLVWKIWCTNYDRTHACGIYLFDNRKDAELRAEYAKKFYPKTLGFSHVQCRIYDVLEETSRVTRAPIDLPANPSCTTEEQKRALFSSYRKLGFRELMHR